MSRSIEKIIRSAFTENKKHTFRVEHLPGVDSFIIQGDVELILCILEIMVGRPFKLFGDYGYTVHVYRSQGKVLLRNYDKYTSARWRAIWRRG